MARRAAFQTPARRESPTRPAWRRRSQAVTTTTPRYTATILVLILLFIGTSFLARAYRTGRQSRAEYHFQLGQKLNQAGNKQAALGQYRTALQLLPDDLSAARRRYKYELALTLVLVDLGHLLEAQSHLEGLLQEDPTNGLLNVTMARIAAREGREEDAVTYYHRAIYGLWPAKSLDNRIRTRLELVDYLLKTGTRPQLVAELVQLQSDLPDDPVLKQRVADLFMEADSPQDAAKLYQEVTASQPHNGKAWAGLGEAEFDLGNYAAAQVAYRRALASHAGSPALTSRLTWVTQYLVLDPTGSRVTSAERFRRIRRLMSLSLASLTSCLDRQGASSPAQAGKLADQASRLLGSRRRIKSIGKEADTELNLTVQLWRAKQSLCPEPKGTGTPLAAVLNRLTRQPANGSN